MYEIKHLTPISLVGNVFSRKQWLSKRCAFLSVYVIFSGKIHTRTLHHNLKTKFYE